MRLVMKEEEIALAIKEYVLKNNPGARSHEPIPLDTSLLELGILDSFGIVELIAFIENNWSIRIFDSEITKEKFGGINKMAKLVGEKISNRK